MIQVDLVVSFMSYTAVYNLELAKKALWDLIFDFRWRLERKKKCKEMRCPIRCRSYLYILDCEKLGSRNR